MDYFDHFKKQFGDYAFILIVLFIFRQLLNPEVYSIDGLLIYACFSVLLCAFMAYMTYTGRWPIWKYEEEPTEE